MIPASVAIFVATTSVDMRRSFDKLAVLAAESMDADPKSGALFVFYNMRCDRLKLLWFDKNGYCLLYKRLDRGEFRIPQAIGKDARRVQIGASELALLLEGIDLPKRRIQPRTIAREGRKKALRAIASMP